MKYIDEKYIKKRCNQTLERLSINSVFLGFIIMIIGVAIQLLDFENSDTMGLVVLLIGLIVITVGLAILANSSETLERRYKVIETDSEEE